MIELLDVQTSGMTTAALSAIAAGALLLATAFITIVVKTGREGRADGTLTDERSRIDLARGAEKR